MWEEITLEWSFEQKRDFCSEFQKYQLLQLQTSDVPTNCRKNHSISLNLFSIDVKSVFVQIKSFNNTYRNITFQCVTVFNYDA